MERCRVLHLKNRNEYALCIGDRVIFSSPSKGKADDLLALLTETPKLQAMSDEEIDHLGQLLQEMHNTASAFHRQEHEVQDMISKAAMLLSDGERIDFQALDEDQKKLLVDIRDFIEPRLASAKEDNLSPEEIHQMMWILNKITEP